MSQKFDASKRMAIVQGDPKKAVALRNALQVLHRAELLMLEAQVLVAQSLLDYAKVVETVEDSMVGVVTSFHNVFVEEVQHARGRMEFLLANAEPEEAAAESEAA